MELDPNTPVGNLIAAIPSAAVVFVQFGIVIDGNERRTLEGTCNKWNIRIGDFMKAIEELDWDNESPLQS